MRITTMVVFILIGSTCFLGRVHGRLRRRLLEHLLTSLPGGVWGFLDLHQPIHLLPGVLFSTSSRSPSSSCRLIGPIAAKILTPVVGADAALIWFGLSCSA